VTGPVVTSAGTVSGPAAVPEDPPDLRATGERIEVLLEAASAGGRVARERAEELVRLVVDLYGAGLERLLDIAYDTGRLDDELLDRLAADDLVASLLAVHGLHPHSVETRVARALDGVRPYLGSHGGDVEFLGLSAGGAVRLRMLGSCDGCPSSSVTLTLAVETAIQAAAPEVNGIEVEEAPTGSGGASVIPVSALRSRLAENPAAGRDDRAGWSVVDGLDSLGPGQVGVFPVAGTPVLAARIGPQLYAYLDSCPSCGSSLADGALERRLGGATGDGVLRCPTCRAHFDVRHAGRGLDGTGTHLEPVPLLVRDGIASVAVPGAVRA
jgi:Fe-S cluster biogenesis protein NfuA/nitrite reductase/ring-hydroxylating ferredoxin subunit